MAKRFEDHGEVEFMVYRFAVAATILILNVGCRPVAEVITDSRLELRDDDHRLGMSDTRVVVIEYGDLECPVCGRFAREVFPTIRSEYIDTGLILWVFRHLALTELHEHAFAAARASECAAVQDGFYEYVEVLFNNQSALEEAALVAYATDLGLDPNVFQECLTSDRHDERISADREDAIALGATGTPTFFINGRIASGLIGITEFRALLDSALEQARP